MSRCDRSSGSLGVQACGHPRHHVCNVDLSVFRVLIVSCLMGNLKKKNQNFESPILETCQWPSFGMWQHWPCGPQPCAVERRLSRGVARLLSLGGNPSLVCEYVYMNYAHFGLVLLLVFFKWRSLFCIYIFLVHNSELVNQPGRPELNERSKRKNPMHIIPLPWFVPRSRWHAQVCFSFRKAHQLQPLRVLCIKPPCWLCRLKSSP